MVDNGQWDVGVDVWMKFEFEFEFTLNSQSFVQSTMS